MSHHTTTVPAVTNLQECQYALAKWYIYCITIHINLKPVETAYWSVYTLWNIDSPSQVHGHPLLGYEWKRCMTTAPEEESAVWTSGKYFLPTYLSESCKCPSHECLLLQRCHSGCSGVVPLSLVVSVSGKSSPGSEGMRRWWWSELLGMAHVFHLLGNSYGSLCNHRSLLCAATWLPRCHEVGVAEMGAARNRTWTTVRLTKKYIKKPNKEKQLIVNQSLGWAALEGWQSQSE